MNDLNKYGILIADVIKELFILLLALCILINFSLKVKENPNILNLDGKVKDCPPIKGDIYDDYFKFLSCLVNNGLVDISQNVHMLQNTNTLYAMIILSMYFFIGLISQINVNHKPSWRNVFNDFINKSTYILLFPFLMITTIPFLYVGYDVIAKIYNSVQLFKCEYMIALGLFLTFIYGYVLFFILFIIYSIVFIYSRDNIQYIVSANRFKNNNKGKNEFINKYKDAKYNGIFNSGVITKGELGSLYDECIGEGKNSYFNLVKTIYSLTGGLAEHHKILNNNVEKKTSVTFHFINNIILFLFVCFMFALIASGLNKVIGFSIYNTFGFVFNINEIFKKIYCADVDTKKIYVALKILIGFIIVYNIYKLFSMVYFFFALIVFVIMIILLLKKQSNIDMEFSCE